MTENPYAPPKAAVEEPPAASARTGALFWVRFYLSPYGRTGRLFYWVFGLLPLLLVGLVAGYFMSRGPEGLRYLPAFVFLLVWPQLVLFVRRLHDMNLSGWWAVLFWVVPYVIGHTPLLPGTGTLLSFFAALVLGLIPGTARRNRYGPNPQTQRIHQTPAHPHKPAS